MIKAIQRFYRTHMQPDSGAITDREASDHALQLATAALLIEISRADQDIKSVEQATILRALREAFELGAAEADELVSLAEQEARQATSLFEFTHLIDKGFSAERKAQVVELLWRVVFADAEMEQHEEHLVRRVADLIHVPHSVFIDTKLRVRDNLHKK